MGKYGRMKHIVFALFLSLSLLPVPARADCVSDCQASTYCGGSSWECAQDQSACYRSCQSSGGGGSGDKYAFGAIAYDEDSGAYGLSDGSASEARAEKSAMKFCKKNGSGCKIVETFFDTCAAIAQDKAGSVAGWGVDENRKDAGKIALKSCGKKADDDTCYVALTHCFK